MLVVLDVSNNKLHHIPKEIWTAPKLKEINASFNLLSDLPNFFILPSFDFTSSSGDFSKRSSFDLSSSPPVSEKNSVTLSSDDDSSLEDARLMRSIQLATINLNPQEITHHRYDYYFKLRYAKNYFVFNFFAFQYVE